jgi:hypothetical protein
MSRRTQVVPTHLRTPETLLTIAGLNLSVRQFLLLVLGATTSYNLWLHLAPLGAFAAGLGQLFRLLLSLLPALLASAFAFIRLAGRTLDRWALVALAYLGRPRRFIWRSVRYQEPDAFGWVAFREADHDEKH